ncbi:hypothetical protein [Methylorubrum extorquens]|uniref:Uncharacterized protein n=1 Tax=Methylorubrum extorquens (strain CM4 / NCIMB 13688) TaxID=440085 RepID=B7KRL6_METC4|nr:hypothetical protein [Methylorubrum extorquens]ACK85543.1 hypothetical protein Mchl_4769 [Methylorubrum extorquens CM4]
MTSFADFLAATQVDPSPALTAAVQSLQDEGHPIRLVIHNEDTGQVLMMDPEGNLAIAPGAIRELVTGEPWRDPGTLNPIATHAVRRSKKRLAAHEAEVRSMLLQLVRYHEPELGRHPSANDFIDEIIAKLRKPYIRGGLSALSDNCERWETITGICLEVMREMLVPNTTAH